MARFTRLTVLNTMVHTGLVPVFCHDDPETACRIVRACAEGGAGVVEFTNREDRALRIFEHLEAFAARELPQIILGTGSIVDAPTAALYIAAGTNFVVGPVLNAEVARLCNRHKIAYSPGCGTASDISAAEELGVEIVKIFPAKEMGGPAFVKSVRAPCPWTSIMPTGGVEPTRENLEAWFRAGVACVGIGSNLIRRDWVEAGNFGAITDLVRGTLATIAEIRRGTPASA
jgi:2-dehydro-3-deoxyphosphogluconate aldolase / (4S)-4-hydroxy-2-oxoglutarate aldolase